MYESLGVSVNIQDVYATLGTWGFVDQCTSSVVPRGNKTSVTVNLRLGFTLFIIKFPIEL